MTSDFYEGKADDIIKSLDGLTYAQIRYILKLAKSKAAVKSILQANRTQQEK